MHGWAHCACDAIAGRVGRDHAEIDLVAAGADLVVDHDAVVQPRPQLDPPAVGAGLDQLGLVRDDGLLPVASRGTGPAKASMYQTSTAPPGRCFPRIVRISLSQLKESSRSPPCAASRPAMTTCPRRLIPIAIQIRRNRRCINRLVLPSSLRGPGRGIDLAGRICRVRECDRAIPGKRETQRIESKARRIARRRARLGHPRHR